jgi:hypothetical protein
MIACAIGVLKGQQDYSPGQSEATPWVCGTIMNFSLFLFRTGATAGAKQEKGKWNWVASVLRAPVSATSALGHCLAGGPHLLPIRALWAARIAQFCR